MAQVYTVYKATHKPTGKIYVGQTKHDIETRKKQHFSQIKVGRKFSTFVRNTSPAEWSWDILHVLYSYKDARDCELYYINIWNLYEVGLNSPMGISNNIQAREQASKRFQEYKARNPEPWNKGRKGVYSEETLEKMRLAKFKKPSRTVYTPEMKVEKMLATTNRKVIIELKSGIEYPSISAAARALNIRREEVRDVVNGKRNHTHGYVFVKKEKSEN